jgi:acyl-CoA thioesterase
MTSEDQEGRPTTRERSALSDPGEFARLLGITTIEARDGYARLSMPSAGKKNPHGVVHGGAIFSLADQAFSVAANAGTTKRVAVSIHIQYIAPAHGDLEAVAEHVSDDGDFSQYRVVVCEGKRIIATCDGVALSDFTIGRKKKDTGE